MAKRKISGIINATEHPMNLETPWNQKQPDGTYHAYAGDDIEAFLKKELSNRTPTEELVGGETKPPTSGTVSVINSSVERFVRKYLTIG